MIEHDCDDPYSCPIPACNPAGNVREDDGVEYLDVSRPFEAKFTSRCGHASCEDPIEEGDMIVMADGSAIHEVHVHSAIT